jgi:hypothetical protein
MPMPGLPLEIQQMAYSHSVEGRTTFDLLANVVFIEWTIVNKGDVPIESTYVSLWTDIDFNEASDNKPAIDTVTQLGYCWQSRDDGRSIPKAVGFVWLYGPQVPSPGDSAVFKGQTRRNERNLPVTSFWGIQDDSFQDESFRGPAYSMRTAWNIARGFDKVGNPVLDSVTHLATHFLYSGDPVSGTGWLCPSSSGGAGFNMFSGPFVFASHDTQWAMAALIPATSLDRLDCVRLLRQYAATLRSMKYDDYAAASSLELPPILPSSPTLLQNYPNPFNPSTVIRYALPERTGVELVVYNTLGERAATLVDGVQDAGFHEATFDGSRSASGVYFYRLKANGHTLTKRLVLLR